jgi:predicted glutamine amidotransferase
MCRLFGSISSGPLDIESHLIRSKTSLLAQSTACDKRIQGDGWGLGSYTKGGRPVIELSTGAIFDEKAPFTAAVGKAGGPVVIGHIRDASNPMNLPREKLLRIENQQPFRYQNWVFAHNGTLKLPAETLEKLGKYQKNMKGNNDSEVFFWLLMAQLEKTGSVKKALAASVKLIMKVWEEAPASRKAEVKLPYVSLNFLLTDGKKLYAVCKYDGYKPKHRDNWLIAVRPPRPLLQMCYRLEKGAGPKAQGASGLVVASERTEPDGNWIPLHDGSLLEASLEGGAVKLRVEKL